MKSKFKVNCLTRVHISQHKGGTLLVSFFLLKCKGVWLRFFYRNPSEKVFVAHHAEKWRGQAVPALCKIH